MDSARSLGAYFFAGMYQQLPTPDGGNHFKEHWFGKRFDDAGKYWLPGDSVNSVGQVADLPRRFSKADCAVFVTCDPAASEHNSADHTAIGVWTVTPENDLLLLDVVRGRFGVDRIVPELLAVCRRWKPGWIALEANGFHVAIAQAARRVPCMAPIRQISHEGKGKLVRATPAIILAESGRLWLPRSAEWLKPFIDELLCFTGRDDRADDQVDMTAYAAWQVRQVFDDPDPPRIEDRPIERSHAAERGLWGRSG
jgi:predicted phage terminase large subunit-like protein